MEVVKAKRVRKHIVIKEDDLKFIEAAAALKTEGNLSRYMLEASTERARKDLTKGK